jgi:hypothetical protein
MPRFLSCRWAVFAALALLPLAAVGCGRPPTATVSGKVTVKGKDPLPGGTITFQLASDPTQAAGGVIKSDGTYTVTGAPVGECKVVIDNSNLDLSKNTGTSTPTGGAPGMGPPGAGSTGGGGPPADARNRMNGPPKGVGDETDDKDAGTKKYVKIDPSFSKAESTPLKHTVVMGDNKDVNFDVK